MSWQAELAAEATKHDTLPELRQKLRQWQAWHSRHPSVQTEAYCRQLAEQIRREQTR